MSEKRLTGRIALVTGASRGIGFNIAKRFAEEGAHVIATARTVGGLEELDDVITKNGGMVTLAPMNIMEFDKIDVMAASIFERFGILDILVGNAGQIGPLSPLSHIAPKDFQTVMDVNVTANYRLLRAFDAILRKSDAGRAIFVTCEAAEQQEAFWSAYAASKAALNALVTSYANEVKKANVNANLVCPGPVATALRARAFPGEDREKLTKASDITDIFVDLAVASSTRNGALIHLDHE